MKKDITIAYSDVESEYVEPSDLEEHPEKYLILDLTTNINCRRCRKRMNIRKNKSSITFLCNCGCRILYPKNSNGDIVSNWIPKEEHKGVK